MMIGESTGFTIRIRYDVLAALLFASVYAVGFVLVARDRIATGRSEELRADTNARIAAHFTKRNH